MSNFSRYAVILFSILFISATGLAQNYGQLATKEQQILALKELILVIKHQYGGLEIKQNLYGLDLEKLEAKYTAYINSATTADEAVGFVPKKKREILSRNEFRYLLVALASELHDGHVSITLPISRATVMGLQTAALEGQLVVTGASRHLQVVRADQEVQVGDIIVAVDGRPIADLKNRNLNYIGNGTIEARKDEALERILEIPHALLPPFSTKETVDLTFQRGGQRFTGTFKWKEIDPIDLTRPIHPSTDTVKKQDKNYKEDSPLVFGAKGMVRSYFMEGLFNLAQQKGPNGQPLIEIGDIGAQLNVMRTGMVKKMSAELAVSQVDQMIQESLSREDMQNFIRGVENMAPVDRLKGYVVQTANNKPFGVIRFPSFAPNGIGEVLSEVAWLEQILNSYKQMGIETVVFDELTNPGGYVLYARLLLSLFATKDKPLRAMKARFVLNDRLINDVYLHNNPMFDKSNDGDGDENEDSEINPSEEETPEEKEARLAQDEEIKAKLAERRQFLEVLIKMNELGERTTPPLPYNLDASYSLEDKVGMITPSEGTEPWEGKLIVLTDGRDASCAEIFAEIIKQNGRGLIMGETTMGLGNPKIGNYDRLNLSELDFTGPFASLENEKGEHIENIGVVPDIIRTIRHQDLTGGFLRYALDVINAANLYSAGRSIREIQTFINGGRLDPLFKALFKSEKIKTTMPIARLVAQMQQEISEIPDNKGESSLEELAPFYQAIYEKFFAQLKDLETANLIPANAWNFIAVPLPYDLTYGDPIMKNATRKDVVLRRLEELAMANRFAGKPKTVAMLKSLYKGAYGINGYFHFNTPCELLLEKIAL